MRHQKGVSYIAILFAIIGLAFMVKVAAAVWGPYFDDRTIDTLIEEQLTSGQKNLNAFAFDEAMNKRFEMNNIRDIKFKDIAQVTEGKNTQVKKLYEIRKPFLLNIDIVMKFEKDFDQSTIKAQ